MKRANRLLPQIVEPENLRLAFWKASKGKRYVSSVLAYQNNLEANLMKLSQQILSGEIEVGNYRYFFVYEPKKREICASAFSEQVLHHALMNICHDHFEKKQIYDSYASRKGKGTYAALDRAQKYTRKHLWFLKLDVRKFFASVHHDVLKGQLYRMFKEKDLLTLFFQIIDSYQADPDRGLPIGNLTSQYFANHYLAGLDHFIKEKLQIKAYVRYMDDMMLWSDRKNDLLTIKEEIKNYLNRRLKCNLKPFQLNRTERGVPFLGYQLFPYYIRLLQKSKVRFVQKLKKIYNHRENDYWDETSCQNRVLPLIAFSKYANSKSFRKKVILSIEGQAP